MPKSQDEDNNKEKDKHIAVKKSTRDRFAKYIPKHMYWDDYVNKVSDFIEKHKKEFIESLED